MTPYTISEYSTIRIKAESRIKSLCRDGVFFSEEESRRIILCDCPECPEEIVQEILNSLGF